MSSISKEKEKQIKKLLRQGRKFPRAIAKEVGGVTAQTIYNKNKIWKIPTIRRNP